MNRAKPENKMRRAIDDKNIEDFLWACLDLATVEIKNDADNRTFSGRDINSFVDQLVKINKDKVVEPETPKVDPEVQEVQQWIEQAKNRDL